MSLWEEVKEAYIFCIQYKASPQSAKVEEWSGVVWCLKYVVKVCNSSNINKKILFHQELLYFAQVW